MENQHGVADVAGGVAPRPAEGAIMQAQGGDGFAVGEAERGDRVRAGIRLNADEEREQNGDHRVAASYHARQVSSAAPTVNCCW